MSRFRGGLLRAPLRCAGCVAGVSEYDPTQARLLWPTQATLPKTFAWGNIARPEESGEMHYNPTVACERQMLRCAGGGKRWRRSIRAAWTWESWLQFATGVLAAPGLVGTYLLGVRTSLLGRALWVIEHDLAPL